MRLHAIVLLALLAAPTVSSAAPVARASKPSIALGKVTLQNGRAHLTLTRVPSDRLERIEAIEIAPSGMPQLANPDDRGVFVGKLKRGRKARVTAADPADKGVGLFAMQGATSVPIYMGLFDTGIHFGSGGHGGVSPAGNGTAALVFGAAVMDGDNVTVDCAGEFSADVEVRVLHLSSTAVDGVEHHLDGSSGQLSFTIVTAGMANGIMLTMFRSPSSSARIDKCVVQRQQP